MATYQINQFSDDDGNIYDIQDDTARATANKGLDTAEAARLAANGIGKTCENYVWLGENIAEKFADEIGGTDPITWLKNRAAAGNFDGLEIGMYLTCTLTNTGHTAMKYQIAGFDTYYGVGDTINGHMITLVPAITYPETVKFNETDTNQGTADNKSPWKASGLYTWMNETFYGYLPTAWKGALKDIRVYNPVRYSEGGGCTDDTGGDWMNLGKVWAPSEIEVWGTWRRGTSLNSPVGIACTDKQLPIFANGRTVIRSRDDWWERAAASGSASYVCCVDNDGTSTAASATLAWVQPLPCFHIG